MEKASQTGGVKSMAIAGRLVSERERLIGMTDAERAFRKQWLQDQILSPNEPRAVPGMYEATHNPIRRFYRWPMNFVEKSLLTPVVGQARAQTIRVLSAKFAMGITAVYYFYYYYKYNSNNWERKGGVRAIQSRPAFLPGDAEYPFQSKKEKGADYASRGFDKVTLNL